MNAVKDIKDRIKAHSDNYKHDYELHDYLDELEDNNKLVLVDEYFQIGTHKDTIQYLNVYKINDKLYALDFNESASACTVEYNDIYEVTSKEITTVTYNKLKRK